MIRGGMPAGTSALCHALAEEQQLYGSLLVLTDREERAIAAGNVEQLTRLVDEKEQLLELLATVETDRMTALTAIAAAVGVRPEGMTLSQVAAHVSLEEAEALTQAGMLLRAQAVALREANERNNHLLRSSAGLVERWIQHLRWVIGGSLAFTADMGTAATRALPRDRAA